MPVSTYSCLTALLALAGTASSAVLPRQATQARQGFRSVGYYGNWNIYGNDSFLPQQIQASALSHVLYSFATLSPTNGTVYLSDPYADYQIRYPGDQNDDPAQDISGNLKQLFLLKKANRNFKTILSIGGWGRAADLSSGLSTSSGRSNFAYSAVQLMLNYGFDGLDIDWEYPTGQADINALVDVCSQIRNTMNFMTAVIAGNPTFYLSLALPSGYGRDGFDLVRLNQTVDFFNLMAYDFTGTWASVTGHSSNLYPSTSVPAGTPASIDAAVNLLVGKDSVSGPIPRKKVILGLPLYGHVFPNTNGVGQPYTQPASVDAATVAYKSIPLDNKVQTDNQAIASYRYDSSTRNWISFDTVATVQRKVDYIAGRWLGGTMFWALNQDRPLSDANSIVGAVKTRYSQVFGPNLEYVPNNLNYPSSKFRNIKNQMAGQ